MKTWITSYGVNYGDVIIVVRADSKAGALLYILADKSIFPSDPPSVNKEAVFKNLKQLGDDAGVLYAEYHGE